MGLAMPKSLSPCAVLACLWLSLFSLVGVAYAATPTPGHEPIMSNGLAMVIIYGLFAIIGILLRVHHVSVMARVAIAEVAHGETRSELDKVTQILNQKINQSHTDILAAIKEQAASTVTVQGCSDRQELWTKELEHQAEVRVLKAAADTKEHTVITAAINDMASHLENIARCLSQLKNGKDCDTVS